MPYVKISSGRELSINEILSISTALNRGSQAVFTIQDKSSMSKLYTYSGELWGLDSHVDVAETFYS